MQMLNWIDAKNEYIAQLTRYGKLLKDLDSRYFETCAESTSLDGLTGAIVRRAQWDLDNLLKWIDGPVFLVAYCSRSLLELSVMMWSIDRNRDFRRWYGFMARDLIELASKVTGTSEAENTEMAAVVQDLTDRYSAAGITIPAGHEDSKQEAKSAGYLKEYNDVFQLLSKFVHPTPLTLLLPSRMVTGTIAVRYCLVTSLKYLRTVYCLAAAQSGYNPPGGEMDVEHELAILRQELDPKSDSASSSLI